MRSDTHRRAVMTLHRAQRPAGQSKSPVPTDDDMEEHTMKDTERAAYIDFISRMLQRAEPRILKIVYEFVLHITA